MRNMVREFQDVYLESTSDEIYVGINSIVQDVLREHELLFSSENILCDVVLEPDLESFRVSRNKLTLVVRNIISNSIDAMLQRGGELKVTGRLAGESINLCICDNGSGIKRDLQELVFEPFFSTKPEVQGAGLGLSVAYGTMTSLGGTITFSSVPGRGACFTVHIPIKVMKK